MAHNKSAVLLSDQKFKHLPKDSLLEISGLYQLEGFWYFDYHLEGTLACQSNFEATSDDVFLASSMKTGTTWLKALCVSIMECQSKGDHKNGEKDDDVLVKNFTHAHIRSLESDLYKDNPNPDLSGILSPRLFHTHMSYNALPDSIKNSACKIVYIARNPKDTLVSMWHFFNKVLRPNKEPYSFEKMYDAFCKGVHPFGPYFDHVLQFWVESLKMPEKILFLKYEELKRDPKEQVKKLATFLGRPFGNEDDVDKVLMRSSLDRLRNLEVNKKW